MSELSPCPFCGREPSLIKASRNSRRHYIGCSIECSVRPEITVSSKREAIEAWNTREESEQIKKLTDALDDVIDGESKYDLVCSTGLSLERCDEIIQLLAEIKENK